MHNGHGYQAHLQITIHTHPNPRACLKPRTQSCPQSTKMPSTNGEDAVATAEMFVGRARTTNSNESDFPASPKSPRPARQSHSGDKARYYASSESCHKETSRASEPPIRIYPPLRSSHSPSHWGPPLPPSRNPSTRSRISRWVDEVIGSDTSKNLHPRSRRRQKDTAVLVFAKLRCSEFAPVFPLKIAVISYTM